MRPLCFLLLLALSCTGCSDPRSRALGRLRQGAGDQLRYDAAMICKANFAGHGADFIVIRARNWPASFQAFKPARVGAYPDGVSLGLSTRPNLDSGLYIVPKSMDHEPRTVPGARFEKLAEGIYWYSFGD